MSISYRYRLIFLRNRRAAGSPITAYLNRIMGPDGLQVGVWRAVRYRGPYNRIIRCEMLSRDGFRAFACYADKLRAPRRVVEQFHDPEITNVGYTF